MTPEGRFKHRLVIPALNQLDNCWFCVKEACSVRGYADIIGVINGRFFAWELKKSEQETRLKSGRSVLQKYLLSKIVKAGGIGRMVCPENIEECLDELRRCNGTSNDEKGNG